jgi:hypothetical protein
MPRASASSILNSRRSAFHRYVPTNGDTDDENNVSNARGSRLHFRVDALTSRQSSTQC